jgi:hypothetical protein
MNELIVAAAGARRRTPTGGVGRLSGASPREQLDGLMAADAEAQRAGDDAAAGYLDHQIESLLDAAQAGGAQSSGDPQTAEPEAEPAPSFDGGFMGRRPPPGPGGIVVETSGQLLLRSLQTYASESRERGSGRRQIGNLSNSLGGRAVSIVIENLPPYEQINSEPIREAAATLSAAKSAQDEAKKALVEAEQTLRSSQWEDAKAAEAARAEGKPEPKTRSHTVAHEKRIADLEREQRVAELALTRARDALEAALAEQGQAWADELTTSVEALRGEWQRDMTELIGLHGRLTAALSVARIAGIGELPKIGALPFGADRSRTANSPHRTRTSPRSCRHVMYSPRSPASSRLSRMSRGSLSSIRRQ